MPKSSPEDNPTPEAAPAQQTKQPFGNVFATLADDKESLRVLYYGQPGTGKTSAALAAANGGKTLVINAEGGVKKTALRRIGVNVENVLLWPQAGQKITAQSLGELYLDLQEQFDRDEQFLEAVVIDSITEIHHLLREQATANRVDKSKREVDPDFVDRDDYGVMTNQVRKLVRQFNNLPCHVILIALERDGEEAGAVRPALTPALSADVMGYMDIVLHTLADYTRPDSLQYFAGSSPSGSAQAKDRFGVLPAELVNSSFERIQGFVSGALDSGDSLQADQNEYLAEQAQLAAERQAEKEARRAAMRGNK